jgi:hypothetical protein
VGVDFNGVAFCVDDDFGTGEDFGVGDGFGTGVCIAINSDTVTNLNPFASSSFSTHGIASIVPG